MRKLFWGFFLLLLNVNIFFFNIFPDWLGYLLLFWGCGELLSESELFGKPRPICIGLSIYAALLWLLDLFNTDIRLGLLDQALSLAAVCLHLYMVWLLICAVSNTEMRRNADLGSARLRSIWKVIAVTAIAATLLAVFSLSSLYLLCMLATLIAEVIFLAAVHHTGKLYRQMLTEQSRGF